MYEGSRGYCTCAILHQLASSRISVDVVFVVDPSTVASYWLLQSNRTQEQREIGIERINNTINNRPAGHRERGSTSSSAAPVLNASDTATTPKSLVALHLSRLEQLPQVLIVLNLNSRMPSFVSSLIQIMQYMNYLDLVDFSLMNVT
jgi:hypothetical protein